MIRRLVESPAAASADTGNLKTIVYGGAPMYAADCKRAMAVLQQAGPDLWPGREPDDHHRAQQGAPCRDRPTTRYEHRLASVAPRTRWSRSAVADPDDRLLPSGEAGEVLVRGLGDDRLLARSEASARTLRGGWLHTGDVGALDEDGFLTLKDARRT